MNSRVCAAHLINNDGIVYGYDYGSVSITASLGSVSASGTLNITPATDNSDNQAGDSDGNSQNQSGDSNDSSGDDQNSGSGNGAAESNIIDEGYCGDDLYWTLYDTGLLEITGSGDMTELFTSYSSPWYAYR
ncbi:MAG: hypothetical protein LUB61_07900 [Eggerthellaceae bacterium]|nr:hypothetical protein [Eggerthellaceae bacterium]